MSSLDVQSCSLYIASGSDKTVLLHQESHHLQLRWQDLQVVMPNVYFFASSLLLFPTCFKLSCPDVSLAVFHHHLSWFLIFLVVLSPENLTLQPQSDHLPIETASFKSTSHHAPCAFHQFSKKRPQTPSRICSAALIWARTLAPTWNNDRWIIRVYV